MEVFLLKSSQAWLNYVTSWILIDEEVQQVKAWKLLAGGNKMTNYMEDGLFFAEFAQDGTITEYVGKPESD